MYVLDGGDLQSGKRNCGQLRRGEHSLKRVTRHESVPRQLLPSRLFPLRLRRARTDCARQETVSRRTSAWSDRGRSATPKGFRSDIRSIEAPRDQITRVLPVFRDGLRFQAEHFRQDRFRVRTELRRRHLDRCRRVGEAVRNSERPDRPRRRVQEFRYHVACRGLRIGDRFVHAVDRAARYVVPPQLFQTGANAAFGQRLRDEGVDRLAVADAIRVAGKSVVVRPLRAVQALGEAGKLGVVADRKCDTAIRTLKCAIGNDVGVTVAVSARLSSAGKVIGGDVHQHRDPGRMQRHLELLPRDRICGGC